MGLDQRRAQITAEWIDLGTGGGTGEISRGRVGASGPCWRAAVPVAVRWTGAGGRVGGDHWVAVRGRGARACRRGRALGRAGGDRGAAGQEKRANTDWADARHLRELLLIGRLPESWIPPDHILDLRATVRCRHTLSDQRTEWQQRVQSVLYHHGCRQRRKLMTAEGCEWLARAGARHRPPSDSRAAVMRRSCLRSSAVSDQSHPAPAADRIGAIRLRSSAKPARWTRRPGSQRAAV
jgi:transposase